MTVLDEDGITELEKFTPERVDGVDLPANGSSFLMLKALGGEAAPNESTEKVASVAATETEARAPEATAPQDAPAPAPAEAQAPAQAAKSAADPETVTVELPADIRLDVSPAVLARMATFKQQLVVEQAAKRDMDPNVGGGTDRDKIPAEDFAGPNRSFPIVKPGDVSDAASSLGRAAGGAAARKAIKAKIIAIAKRKGQAFVDELPEAWKGGAAKAKAGQCPACSKFSKAGAAECEHCGGEMEKAKARGGKKKPFKGAAEPFKADKDGDGEAPEGKDGNGKDADGETEKAAKGPVCKCGCNMAKSDKFCRDCGEPAGGRAEKGKIPSPEDAAVAGAIDRAKEAVGDALDAQDSDPDKDSHPADAKVEAYLGEAKHAIGNAEDAQEQDIDEDDPEEHGMGKSAATEPPAYHLQRLHDATCAAFRHDDVVIAHPSAAKGIGALADPQAFAKMTQDALDADGGTGAHVGEIQSLSTAYACALALKAVAPLGLDDAMDGLRKAFAEFYPTAHPVPGAISPGEFRRPYVSAGRANQSAKPGQEPRVPMSSHVPEASDFRRPLVTAGREAASPGSDPRPNGLGKAGRSYYTNAARDGAVAALTGMHDWIADTHPGVCSMAGVHPMAGLTYEGEPGQPGAMGSSLTTAKPVPAQFAATKDKASPVPVGAAAAAAVVTPAVTKAHKKAAKAARKAAQMAESQAAQAGEPITAALEAAQAPLIDPGMLKSVLREVVAEQLGDVAKNVGDLTQRIADLESAPDPAQMAPRSGSAMAKNANAGSPEVPAGGDGHQVERLARLVKRAKDPDSNVRAAAIGELIDTAGREAAAQLLEAAY